MAESDGKQAGVNIYVTLSTQLFTATLGIIAIWGAFLTYNLEKNDPGWPFFTSSMLALALFVLSMYMGGKGINALAMSAFNNAWSLKSGSDYFSTQTACCLAGLVLFVASVFLRGQAKVDENAARDAIVLRTSLIKLDSEFRTTHDELKSIATQITKLEHRLSTHMQKTAAHNLPGPSH